MVHRLVVNGYVITVIAVLVWLIWQGKSYYNLPVEKRFFSEQHEAIKPSGSIGHGLGIIGSLLMVIGVSSYMIRKRSKKLMRWGKLKNWLEFHIFLCTLGPILVLFHTAFKFGGIVAISFWSMVAVVLSGVIGRFIYNQIPRSIQGNELSLAELLNIKNEITFQLALLPENVRIKIDTLIEGDAEESVSTGMKGALIDWYVNQKKYFSLKSLIRNTSLQVNEKSMILDLIFSNLQIKRKIKRLKNMQALFRMWHIVHLPFALIMLIIMVVHIIITITFGYKWIF